MRIGQGYDIHRLQAGGKLVLGGITVASDISPISHSDGDVVIHALVDAILGALAMGDIGERFPNTDPRFRGASSETFLNDAVRLVGVAGLRIANADVTVLAEKPKLNSFKTEMSRNLERILGAPTNVKAGTNEGCDAIGRGEAIAAHAVVLLAAGF